MSIMDINLVEKLFGDHSIFTIMSTGSINDLISAILPNLYIIAGLIVLIYLAFGGFTVITGGGDTKATEQGKEMITKAAIGFLIIFASYWIVEIIEIVTGLTILG
jgi:hypothetical protein